VNVLKKNLRSNEREDHKQEKEGDDGMNELDWNVKKGQAQCIES